MRDYQRKYLRENPEQREMNRLRAERWNKSRTLEQRREFRRRYRKSHGTVWIEKELLQAARDHNLVPRNVCVKALNEAINQAKDTQRYTHTRGRHKRL